MKRSPLGSVKSVTRFSRSLKSCAERAWADANATTANSNPVRKTLTLQNSYTSIEDTNVDNKPLPQSSSAARLGPRVPRKYRHDCCLAASLRIINESPEERGKNMGRHKQNLEAAVAIRGDRREDRQYGIHLDVKWKLI